MIIQVLILAAFAAWVIFWGSRENWLKPKTELPVAILTQTKSLITSYLSRNTNATRKYGLSEHKK